MAATPNLRPRKAKEVQTPLKETPRTPLRKAAMSPKSPKTPRTSLRKAAMSPKSPKTPRTPMRNADTTPKSARKPQSPLMKAAYTPKNATAKGTRTPRTPLRNAAMSPKTPKTPRTPLRKASMSPKIPKTPLTTLRNSDTTPKSARKPPSPLTKAAFTPKNATAKGTKTPRTPLRKAALSPKSAKKEMLEVLASEGTSCDVDARDSCGDSALYYAAYNNDPSAVETLLKTGRANVEERLVKYTHQLGHKKIVTMFFDHLKDTKKDDSFGISEDDLKEEEEAAGRKRKRRSGLVIDEWSISNAKRFHRAAAKTYKLDINLDLLVEQRRSRWRENNRNLRAAVTDGDAGKVAELLKLPDTDVSYEDEENNCLTVLQLAAEAGNLEVVSLLVNSAKIRLKTELNRKTKDRGLTALHMACKNGKMDVVRLFLEQEAADFGVESNEGWTPIMEAAFAGHLSVVQALVEEVMVVKKRKMDDQPSETVLRLAASAGHLDIVRFLLESGAGGDVNQEAGDQRTTALHEAAIGGHVDVVGALLATPKIRVYPADRDGRTPLHHAAMKGFVDVARLLLEKDIAGIDAADKEGLTALYAADMYHKDGVMAAIDSAMEDYEEAARGRKRRRRTTTASSKKAKRPRTVTTSGADSSTLNCTAPPDAGGDAKQILNSHRPVVTTVNLDENNNEYEVLSEFDKLQQNVTDAGHEKGDAEESAGVLRQYDELAAVQDESKSPVHDNQADDIVDKEADPTIELVNGKNMEIIELDATASTKINEAVADDSHAIETPSETADPTAKKGEEVETDIDLYDDPVPGPSVEKEKKAAGDLFGDHENEEEAFAAMEEEEERNWLAEPPTSLHIAVEKGSVEAVVEFLNSLPADEVSRKIGGLMAAHKACYRGDLTVAAVMLTSPKVDVDARTDNGLRQTALHIVAAHKKPALLRLVLERTRDVDVRDARGQTALMLAAAAGREEAVAILFHDEGARGDLKCAEGRTALMAAAGRGHGGVVRQMLLQGPDRCGLNAQCERDGKTALFYAAEQGHLDVVKALASEPGLQWDLRSLTGRTVLHNAANAGRGHAVKELLAEAPASLLNARTRGSGKTALHLASMNEKRSLAVRALLDEAHIDLNAADAGGNTALHFAAASGSAVAAGLLAKRHDVAWTDNGEGVTPLLSAMLKDEGGAVAAILKYRKDTIDREEIETAMELAWERGRRRVIRVLDVLCFEAKDKGIGKGGSGSEKN